VLVTEHLSAPAAASDDLAAQLQGGAPAFFKVCNRLGLQMLLLFLRPPVPPADAASE